MANPYHGAITDVWKHLPLAEILLLETPAFYWDSHAGSSEYFLTHSSERDYGVFHFIREAARFPHLERSAYRRLLRTHERGGELVSYPGSPLIAMRSLGRQDTQLLFCDTDQATLATIERAARALEFTDGQVLAIKSDGPALVSQALQRAALEDREALLVFIDAFAPFLHQRGYPSSVELFALVAGCGVRAVSWYHFLAPGDRQQLFEAYAKGLADAGVSAGGVWWGEIAPNPFPNPGFDFNHVCVRGCGILCANLGARTLEACETLGTSLSASYAGSVAGGTAGEIAFTHGKL